MPAVISSTTASRQAPPTPAPATLPPSSSSSASAPSASTIAELQASLRQMTQALQLSRANTMALMRMQLAVRSGERLQAMEAMDRLDTLDAELARMIQHLPRPAGTDPAWQLVAKHVEEQKLALAFEKLALASGIVGPDMVSIENAWSADEHAPSEPESEPDFPRADMPDLSPLRPLAEEFEARPRRALSPQVLGLALTLLVVAGIAAAVWLSMQP